MGSVNNGKHNQPQLQIHINEDKKFKSTNENSPRFQDNKCSWYSQNSSDLKYTSNQQSIRCEVPTVNLSNISIKPVIPQEKVCYYKQETDYGLSMMKPKHNIE